MNKEEQKNMPDNWQKIKLGNIGRIISGGTPSTDKLEYWNGDIHWITPTEITKLQGKYILNTERKITKLGLKKSSAKLIPAMSLVICSRATVGDCGINKIEITTNQGFKNIIPNIKINIHFLYYFICTQKLQLKRISSGSTFLEFSKFDLEKIKFLLPPLPEQNHIVAILETWDKYLEKLSRKIEIKKNIKKGLMQRLLTGKVCLDGFSGEWEEKKLGDISVITTGNSNREDSILDGKYTFFDRSEDVRSSSIYLFDGEAVIVAGEGQKFVPKYFIGKFDLHQRTYAIMNFNNADGKFIYYYLSQNKNYLLSQAVGSTVKSLRLPMFIKMPIKIPKSQKEQTAIAKILTTADKEIEALGEKKKIIEEQKKFLLNNLVTGKIRTV